MDSIKHTSVMLTLISLLALVNTSCDKSSVKAENWLVGTWVVDRDETTEYFINGVVERYRLQGDGWQNTIASIAASKIASKTVAGVIEPLDNLEFKFTEDFQYSKEAVGIGGKGKPYKIIDRPEADQITISEGGKNRTYTKKGRLIWYKEDIKVGSVKIYLKRIAK